MNIVLPLRLGNTETGQDSGEHLGILQLSTCAGVAVSECLLELESNAQEGRYLCRGFGITDVIDEQKLFRPVAEMLDGVDMVGVPVFHPALYRVLIVVPARGAGPIPGEPPDMLNPAVEPGIEIAHL